MTYTPRYTTADKVYAKTGLTSSQVDLTATDYELIQEAEAELEMLTGRSFANANAITEYLSIKDKDITDKYQSTIQLNHFPVQSITLFKEIDMDGNSINTFGTLTAVQVAAGTYDTTDYWLTTSNDPLTNTATPNGKIALKTASFAKGTNNVKVSYTYGYTTVPSSVSNLATCMAGIRMWLTFLGGQYNRANSYSLPEESFNKGDFYDRGKANMEALREEAEYLLDRIGRKPRVLFFSTGDSR
jgi:hypothetical protein